MGHFFEVTFGRHRIPVHVQFDGFTTLRISVKPDGTVSVRAPKGTALEDIQLRVARKAKWIFRQLETFRAARQITPPRLYLSGETHYYLGRKYRLRVRQGERNDVRLAGRFFEVTTANPPKSEKVRELMDAWYLRHARAVFDRKVEEIFQKIAPHGISSKPTVIVRAMESRWGSCSRKGNITINRHLIKAPVRCLEYVLTHEICHMKHYSHTKEFYNLLSQIMPDWKNIKLLLVNMTINNI